MKKEITTIEIHDRVCHIYKKNHIDAGDGKNGRIFAFYWGISSGNSDSIMTVVSYLEPRLKKWLQGTDILLTAYESGHWNDDFSPWKAPAVFGNEDFGGNADKTLDWLLKDCIPYIEDENSGYINSADEILRFIAGYSLAGLFSLWAYGKCNVFAGAVSCSGSLWYKGWLEYLQENIEGFKKDGARCIYLSLGDKEEKTKNRLMSDVGKNTRRVYELLNKDIKCTLEWNAGGHFAEPDIRIAKGIYWILSINYNV